MRRRVPDRARPSSTGCSAAASSRLGHAARRRARASARARCCSRRSAAWPSRARAACSSPPRSRAQQVRLRAERLGALAARAAGRRRDVAARTSIAHVDAVRPDVVVVDSIQTVPIPTSPGAPGSVVQVRECAHRLVQEAKDRERRRWCSSATSPRTAGSPGRACSSTSSTRCSSFEGDRHHALRLLRALKHRFGSHQRARAVRDDRTPGSSACPTRRPVPRRPPHRAARLGGRRGARGHRPLLVEVQALVAPTRAADAAAVGQGIDRQPAGAAAGRARHARAGSPSTPTCTRVGRRRAGHRARRRPRGRARRRPALRRAAGRRPIWWRAARSASAASCARSPRRPRRLAEAARLGFTRAHRAAASARRRRAGRHRHGRCASRPLTEALATLDWRLTVDADCVYRERSVPGRLVGSAARRAVGQPCWHALGCLCVAPGTPLREGLDRIVQAKMGALVVVGDGPDVLDICSGGFLLDAAFTPAAPLASWPRWTARSSSPPTLAASPAPTCTSCPTRTCPPPRPAPATAPPSGSARSIDVPVISVSEEWGHRDLPPRARSTRSSRSRGCSTAPTRRCRRSSATRPASTR